MRVNDEEANKNPAKFRTGIIGSDNAIARHGIHGLYWLFNIDIKGDELVQEEMNTIYLTQATNTSPLQGFMYDFIRLEAPPSSAHLPNPTSPSSSSTPHKLLKIPTYNSSS